MGRFSSRSFSDAGSVRARLRRAVIILSCTVAVLVPVSARAHPLLDEAHAAAERADFPAAFDALGRLDAASDLPAGELADFLFTRALVHFALGDERAMERDLARLAQVAPDHPVADTVGPAVRRAAEAARRSAEPVRLVVRAEPVPGGLALRAEVSNDANELVREVRIHARAPGAAWVEARGETMTVPAAPGARIELFAEAVGPGGATVARSGSPEAPHEAVAAPAAVATASEGGSVAASASSAAVAGDDDDEGGGIGPGWLVLIGVGIAAAIGVVLAFAILPSDSDETQFDTPSVMGFAR